MKSERYIVNYNGSDSRYYTSDYVAMCWKLAADLVYESSNLYVTGTVEASKLICGGNSGCQPGDAGHRVIAVRNPAEAPDEAAFREAALKVITDTREMLGNPNMNVVIDNVEYYYFRKV